MKSKNIFLAESIDFNSLVKRMTIGIAIVLILIVVFF